MTGIVLAPPRRRTQKIDMNDWFTASSPFLRDMAKSWRSSASQIAVARRWLAEGRPEWGLGGQVTSLTHLQIPGAAKIDNTKIAKNALPTLSLTLSSHAHCRRTLANGQIQVLNTCAWAGACAAVCVLDHGRGQWDAVKAARNWRTAALYDMPMSFIAVLRHEIVRAAEKVGGPFLARLNVNSDLPWQLIPELFADVPIQAYDYTKDPSVLDGDGWVVPGKYRKIYSWNETSDPLKMLRFLDRGGSVAVVTNRKKGQPVKQHGGSFDVVDGDKSDDRFNTPGGVIVDLYAKGAARTKRSAFVVKAY